jgi:hypothetical protein
LKSIIKILASILKGEKSVRVRAKCGYYFELRDGDLNDEELKNEKFKRELNEKKL